MTMQRRLPAEWEDQDGVMLAWPHAASDWKELLPEVEPVFARICAAISRRETVLVVAPESGTITEQIVVAGGDPSRLVLQIHPTNDTWSRDFGPLTVVDAAGPLLLDFGFNGWGLKFAACHDNRVTQRLHRSGVFGGVRREVPGLILEGGSIESDGKGTLLTTSECLLEPNRNPHLSRKGLEGALARHFGCDHQLWLDHGYLAGDDTDSHIDTLARLCPDDTILYVACDDPQDEHYDALRAMQAQLQGFRTRSDRPFRLLALPWPRAIYDEAGERLPATYANYLVINGAVLVPVYGDPVADPKALEAIAAAYPDRELVPIDCRPLILQHGSLHCVTMQLPRGVLGALQR